MAGEAGRVLVTGGAGFIGSHTVEALLAEGRHVRVLDDFSAGRRENLPEAGEALEIVDGDVRDAGAVATAMRDASHCLHLAAQVSVARSVAEPARSAEHNVLGTVNVFQAAREAGVSRVVYASSAAVYGDPDPGELPLTEDAPPRPLAPYGLEKWIDERYADLYRSMAGLSALGLRYFNVYGPRQDPASPYAGVISVFVDCLLSGRTPCIFGDGRQSRDFIYVADVARANLAALSSPREGVCNVATRQGTEINELFAILRELTGAGARPRYESAREGDILHSLGSVERMRAWLDVTPAWTLRDGLAALVATSGAGDETQ